jgi:hypothetical protein
MKLHLERIPSFDCGLSLVFIFARTRRSSEGARPAGNAKPGDDVSPPRVDNNGGAVRIDAKFQIASHQLRSIITAELKS